MHFECVKICVLNFFQIEKIGGPISQPQVLAGMHIAIFFRGFTTNTEMNLLLLGT